MTVHPPFESLVRNHSVEIHSYLWRLLGEPADAEDLLQETFLRAFRAYARLRAPDGQEAPNYRAWLYRIATNTANTYLRRRARQEAWHTPLEVEASDPRPPVPVQAQARLELAAVRDAVDRLPEKQRLSLLMRKFQGLGYSDIGAALDCSPAAARANVYQALLKLRAQFPQEGTR